jgi:hypothetical protein
VKQEIVMANCSNIVFASLALIASFALAPAHGASDSPLLGRWFTEGDERGVHIQVFMENKADGTYVKDVRAIQMCDVAGTGKEAGKWTYDQGNFATTSETLDGKPITGSYADTHDLFTVTRVDDSHINLFDTETKLTWGLQLVSDSFSFPPPRGCSI